ncbi:hypothetical protein GCM10027452_40200 [Micromonospora halotolerans]
MEQATQPGAQGHVGVQVVDLDADVVDLEVGDLEDHVRVGHGRAAVVPTGGRARVALPGRAPRIAGSRPGLTRILPPVAHLTSVARAGPSPAGRRAHSRKPGRHTWARRATTGDFADAVAGGALQY